MIGWLILIALFAYFCGSFPAGYLIAKRKGVDIKKEGSGATGGTNVARILGWKSAIPTVLIDVFKVWLPVFLAVLIFTGSWPIFPVAVLAMLGHIFPVWLKFKGGKGITSLVGILLALNFNLFLFYLLAWAVIFVILTVAIKVSRSSFSEKMAASNLLVVWYLPVLFWFFFGSLGWLIFAVVLIGIIYFAHRENIFRMKEKFKNTLKNSRD